MIRSFKKRTLDGQTRTLKESSAFTYCQKVKKLLADYRRVKRVKETWVLWDKASAREWLTKWGKSITSYAKEYYRDMQWSSAWKAFQTFLAGTAN